MRNEGDMANPATMHRWPTNKVTIPDVIELAQCKKCKIKVPMDQRRAHLSRCSGLNVDKLFVPVEKVEI